MKENRADKIIKAIIRLQQPRIHQTLLSFLDLQLLRLFFNSLQSQQHLLFFKMAITKYYLQQYINRVDPTDYFLFYGQPQMHAIQAHRFPALAEQSFGLFYRHYNAITAVKRKLQTEIDGEQFTQIVEETFYAPSLPLPKMKREMVGMHCQTPFQQFLCLLKFPEEEQLEPQFQRLKEDLDDTRSTINLSPLSPQTRDCMDTVRFCGGNITLDNYQSFYINNFPQHNIVVCLLVLARTLQEQAELLVRRQNDPLLKLAEFSLRSNIYRNMVLNVQAKMGFVFQQYDEIYQTMVDQKIAHPSFTFWRPAMSIWMEGMSKFHSQFNDVLALAIAQQRQQSLLEYLYSKVKQIPSIYKPIINGVQSSDYLAILRSNTFSGNCSNEGIQNIKLKDGYQLLTKDYLEYMVDLSINEYNVHWCGHSQHTLGQPFQQLLDLINKESLKYYQHLSSILLKKSPKQLYLGILKDVVKTDLRIGENKFLKPVIQRHVCENYNAYIREEIDKMAIRNLFAEENYPKGEVHLQYKQKDSLLDYFGEKARIPKDCKSQEKFMHNIGCPLTLSAFRQLCWALTSKDCDAGSSSSQETESQISDKAEA